MAERKKRAPRERPTKEADLAKVVELHERGLTLSEIVQATGRPKATVWRDLREMEQRWIKDGMMDMQRVRMRQFRELRQARDEAWLAWKKSKDPAKEVTQKERKAGKGSGGNSSEASVKTIHREGNAKFLQLVKDLISLEADLVGTKVPKIIAEDGDAAIAAMSGGIVKIPAFMPAKPPPA